MRFHCIMYTLFTFGWLCTQATFAFSCAPRSSSTWGVTRPSLFLLPATNTATVDTVDAVELVKHLSREALKHVGTKDSLQALKELNHLCSQRRPYDFESKAPSQGDSVLSPLRKILPVEATEAFLKQVHRMEENGWMSTNPDSVDDLPSLHLNLVSGGRPLFDENEELGEFEKGIQKLLNIVEPHVYHRLLPTVQSLMNSTDIVVSDIFLRRYGEEIVEGATRQGISAHYDVYSLITAVIAMDDVAVDGKNGLYTTETSASTGETSNHASLRRFFPLESGDGVAHTWDVLHGVDVEPGLDRTSLIVWFSTKEAMANAEDPVAGKSLSPWLSSHQSHSNNDVEQFVLASAIESTYSDVDGVDTSAKRFTESEHSEALTRNNPHEIYLESAEKGNAFALTRLGSLCAAESLTPQQLEKASDILASFDAPEMAILPLLEDADRHSKLARMFWLHGAIRGNPLAQVALGDEAMEVAVTRNRPELRVLAATLFGLAAQQGLETAADSLGRVIDYEASCCESEEAFMASPVLQVFHAAMQ